MRLLRLFGALLAIGAALAAGMAVFAGAGAAAGAAVPGNTSPPTISGTPQEGKQLSGDKGVWSGAPTGYSYFWMRCDKNGGSCSNISGATALTYTLGSADVGNTVRFKVQATNADGSTSASSVPSAVITAAAKAPPVNSSRPTISGVAQEGQKLTGDKGTWSGSPTDYNLYWTRCNKGGNACVNIAGATAATYTLTTVDVGHTLRFKVGAANTDGRTFASSDQTDLVTAAAPALKNTAPPTISGTPKVGQTMTADTGSWGGNPTSFTYQWQRCDADIAACSNLAGATGKTYIVPLADLGYRLRVVVTAHTAKGTAAATSAITTVVAPVTRIVNQRPTLAILRVQFTGSTVYARFRICDDSFKNLAIRETDSRPGKLPYTRSFATLAPPRPCGVYTRHWLPVARFRGPGRYTLTLRATDKSGLTSLPARRTFSRG